jgi:hypothetical protein
MTLAAAGAAVGTTSLFPSWVRQTHEVPRSCLMNARSLSEMPRRVNGDEGGEVSSGHFR